MTVSIQNNKKAMSERKLNDNIMHQETKEVTEVHTNECQYSETSL